MSELWSRLLDYATYEWIRENSEIADDLEAAGRQLAQLQREKAALQAMVNELREVGKFYAWADSTTPDGHVCLKESDMDKLDAVIAKNPTQSLADRDMQIAEKVREACARSCDVERVGANKDDHPIDRAIDKTVGSCQLVIRNLNLSEVISDE